MYVSLSAVCCIYTYTYVWHRALVGFGILHTVERVVVVVVVLVAVVGNTIIVYTSMLF